MSTRGAMIHVFFSERQAARIPDIPADTPTKTNRERRDQSAAD